MKIVEGCLMHIPQYEDALITWHRVEPRLRVIAGGCLIVTDKIYRPTAVCAGRRVNLARVAFIAEGGVIPEGTTCLRHTCDNLRCVNPNHLIPGDDLTNARDRRDRGRGGVGWHGDVCGRGHDTAVTGVYTHRRHGTSDRGRVCAECARQRSRSRSPRQGEAC